VELGFRYVLLYTDVPFFHGPIRVPLDSELVAFMIDALGDPAYHDRQLLAFDLSGGDPSPGAADWARRSPAIQKIGIGAPAGDSCDPFDSLTVLVDGHRAADEAYRASGSPHGQPSIVVGVTEPGGRRRAAVVDLGESADDVLHNVGQWSARAESRGAAPLPSATVISHLHTLQMYLPRPPGAKVPHVGPEAFAAKLERLAPGAILGSNLDAFCGLADDHAAALLCERPLVTLEPGIEPLVWSGGTPSQRVYLATVRIHDHALPFEPTETALVVASPPGYLVYSVCSHMPLQSGDDALPAFHVVHQIRSLMAEAQLPDGPIHTLVTGGCGVETRASIIARGQGGTAQQVHDRELQRLVDEFGLRRLFLAHCGVDMAPRFTEALGDSVQLAVPGTCIPLSTPDP